MGSVSPTEEIAQGKTKNFQSWSMEVCFLPSLHDFWKSWLHNAIRVVGNASRGKQRLADQGSPSCQDVSSRLSIPCMGFCVYAVVSLQDGYSSCPQRRYRAIIKEHLTRGESCRERSCVIVTDFLHFVRDMICWLLHSWTQPPPSYTLRRAACSFRFKFYSIR
jgi:hypothetical protein